MISDTATILNWHPETFNQTAERVWTWNGSYVAVKGYYTSYQNYVCKSGADW